MGIDKNKGLQEYIANRLKQLREQKDVTQQEVYNDTEIHIGRIEAKTTNITVSTLSELCKYFGTTLSSFFKGYEK